MPNAGSMTTAAAASPSRVTPQPVVAPLTRTTIFLVLTVNPNVESLKSVRSLCGDLPKLIRAVGFRDLEGKLSCVIGFGSDAWDRLFAEPRPAELHPLRRATCRVHAGRSAFPHSRRAPRYRLRVGDSDHGEVG